MLHESNATEAVDLPTLPPYVATSAGRYSYLSQVQVGAMGQAKGDMT